MYARTLFILGYLFITILVPTVWADDNINLDGSYFYGSMRTDVTSPTYEPYCEEGTENIFNPNVNLLYTSTTNFMPSIKGAVLSNMHYDSAGWLNMLVDNGSNVMEFVGTATDTMHIFVERVPSVYNELGISLSFKKAVSASNSTVAGSYSIYGHYIGYGDYEQWSTSTSGTVEIDAGGTLSYSVSSGFDPPDLGVASYTVNPVDSTMSVNGVGISDIFGISQDGILTRFDTDTSDGELFYEILVKRPTAMTMNDVQGCWNFQAYVTEEFPREPHSAWGRVVLFNNGEFIVDNSIYVITDSTESGTVALQPDGQFTVVTDLGLWYAGTVNETGDVAVMQMGQPGLFHGIGIAVKMPLEPTADNDNDGVTNSDEFAHRIDPLNPDTDGDGMPDGWELSYNLNPKYDDSTDDDDIDGLTCVQEYYYMTSPLLADTDNDGLNDKLELTAGTDPNDPASVFSVVSLEKKTMESWVTVRWMGSSIASYTIYWKDSLDGQWYEVSSPGLTYDDGVVFWMDSGDATSTPPRPTLSQTDTRYYKITAQ